MNGWRLRFSVPASALMLSVDATDRVDVDAHCPRIGALGRRSATSSARRMRKQAGERATFTRALSHSTRTRGGRELATRDARRLITDTDTATASTETVTRDRDTANARNRRYQGARGRWSARLRDGHEECTERDTSELAAVRPTRRTHPRGRGSQRASAISIGFRGHRSIYRRQLSTGMSAHQTTKASDREVVMSIRPDGSFRYDGQWRQVRTVVLGRDGYRCQLRGDKCTEIATEVDHLVPVSAGGALLDPDNCRAACGTCNRSRGGRIGAAITNAQRVTSNDTPKVGGCPRRPHPIGDGVCATCRTPYPSRAW